MKKIFKPLKLAKYVKQIAVFILLFAIFAGAGLTHETHGSSGNVKTYSQDEIIKSLGQANNFAVFAKNFTNNNHMEGSIAVENLLGASSNLGNTDNVYIYTEQSVFNIKITKTLGGQITTAQTFKIGAYLKNSDGSYNTNCSGIDGDEPSFWCSPMAFDSDGTNSYDESDANNVGYFIKNIYAPRVSSSLPNTTNITLPTAEQLANADGKVFSQSPLDLTSSWLLTTNYWTQSSTSTSSNVWFISGNTVTAGGLRGNNASTSLWYGVRPVITTLKTNLLAQ